MKKILYTWEKERHHLDTNTKGDLILGVTIYKMQVYLKYEKKEWKQQFVIVDT